MTNLQYLASSRGKLITPKSNNPPPISVINDELQKCCSNGQRHLATVFIKPLRPYTEGVRLTLDKSNDTGVILKDVKKKLSQNYLTALNGRYALYL